MLIYCMLAVYVLRAVPRRGKPFMQWCNKVILYS